jgi:hypothetical protein
LTYHYTARDPMGRKVEGEIEASTQEQVVKELKGRALEPVSIRLVSSKARMIPEDRLEAVREEPVEFEMAADASESAPQEKGGISRWFGVILLVVYLVMKACN